MMPIVTETDFNEQIKLNDFKRAYFIYGKEKYLVDYYTKKLTDKVLSEGKNSFNLQDFSMLDFDMDMFHDAVEALPLMATTKCVRLFDFDVEKENQETLKTLKEIISDVPGSTIVIMSQKSIEIDQKRSSKWISFIKFFEKHGEVLELSPLAAIRLKRQLIKWAEKLSCDLSEDNAWKMIKKCGDNLYILKQELEKLCAYVNKSEIKSEDIDKIVIGNIETNIFELTKAITMRNYGRAYEVLDNLFYKREEPTAVLSIMASIYIDMYRVKVAEQNGKTLKDIEKIFDYERKKFRLDNAKNYVKRASIESIRKCLDLITDVDVKLKSSRIDSKVLLEELITKLSEAVS